MTLLKKLNKYSGTHAKVKVMYRNLLKEQDYQDLLAKNTVVDVAAYLKNNTNYKTVLSSLTESNIHRGQLEKLLHTSMEQEFVRLISFLPANEKRFMRIYILCNEIELLKIMLRELESGTLHEFNPEINPYYLKHFKIEPQKLIESKNRHQFIENLKGTPYYLILSQFLTDDEYLDIFKIEMALDVYYFKQAWHAAKKLLEKHEGKLVSSTLGNETDMLNIMWILRSKRYFNVPNEIIYSFLLPMHYRIKKEKLIEIVESPTYEAAIQAISTTKYGDVFKDDNQYIEQHYLSEVTSMMHKQKVYNPFSIMSVLVYIHIKQIELQNIIKIIEGIRYNVDKSEIEKYLIRVEGERVGS